MLAELAGRATGLNRGRGGSMHAADFRLGIYGANAIVGAAGPIAVGAAWAHRGAGTDRVAVSFFGDGAMNQGVLLESLNLAALWRVPVVFVCENNGYATTLTVEQAVAGTITGPCGGVRHTGRRRRRHGCAGRLRRGQRGCRARPGRGRPHVSGVS